MPSRSVVVVIAQGASIPSAWLLVVPFASIYWMWKWAGGIAYVTRGKATQGTSFALVCLVGLVGIAFMQDALNEAIAAGLPAQLPSARVV